MDRWMDGGGMFMASVSRGKSHFAREHSKRWHTKNRSSKFLTQKIESYEAADFSRLAGLAP